MPTYIVFVGLEELSLSLKMNHRLQVFFSFKKRLWPNFFLLYSYLLALVHSCFVVSSFFYL